MLVAAGAAALVAGAAVGAGAGGDGHARRAHVATPAAAAAGLTLSQQVGQLLDIPFAGTRPPAYVLRALRESRAGGVILFGSNVRSPAQLRALTRSLQRAAGGSALICADQEGGTVRIVRFAPPAAPPPQLRTPGAAGAAARSTARALRAYGVNVNLAPVADVAVTAGSAMRGRAFAGDAPAVARLVRATVAAYSGGRVAATVKHFPGLGSANRNTDYADRVVISGSGRSLRARELVPFRAAIAAGAPLVMSSHAIYPALSALPASQSRAILVTLLRGELGFRGVTITDSLEARAVLSRSSVATAAVRSIRAGNDIALMTGPGSYRKVRLRLLAEARHSVAFRRRVAEAAGRVLELKRRLRLAPVRPR